MAIRVGVSLMPTDDWRRAALPLFAAGVVDAIEWGPEVRYADGIPRWYDELLTHYGDNGRLYAHGVHYSTLTAAWGTHQERWLSVVGQALKERPHRHLSEHLGFMVAPGFDRGAPLPMPLCREVVALGQKRVQRLADLGIRVGLENLAVALSRRDVLDQGSLLEAVLAPVDGFVLLDLHNLWCQAHNFDIDPVLLLDTMPLHRVRELHVSGGSWTPLPDHHRSLRRDTHDGPVPAEVFRLLELILPRLPRLELVVLERMGGTFRGAEDEATFARDFLRLRDRVQGVAAGSARRWPAPKLPTERFPDIEHVQSAIIDALYNGTPVIEAAPPATGWAGWLASVPPHAEEHGRRVVGLWSRKISREHRAASSH